MYVTKELVKRLGMMVIGGLIVRGIVKGASNMLDGKDILGRKKVQRRKTYVDWKGNVILGKDDGMVA